MEWLLVGMFICCLCWYNALNAAYFRAGYKRYAEALTQCSIVGAQRLTSYVLNRESSRGESFREGLIERRVVQSLGINSIVVMVFSCSQKLS